MKKVVLFLLVVLFATNISAQTLCKKGTWIVGLNPVDYSIYSYNTSAVFVNGKRLSQDTSKSNGIGFALNLGVGYFVKDNLCVGAGFGSTLGNGWGISQQYVVLPTNLFVRYYLMQKIHKFSFARQDNMRRFAFFIESTIDGAYSTINITINNKLTQTKSYSYGAKIAIGYTYMFTKHLALELMGMSNYIITNQTSKSTTSTDKTIGTGYGFNLLFGVQAYF